MPKIDNRQTKPFLVMVKRTRLPDPPELLKLCLFVIQCSQKLTQKAGNLKNNLDSICRSGIKDVEGRERALKNATADEIQ